MIKHDLSGSQIAPPDSTPRNRGKLKKNHISRDEALRQQEQEQEAEREKLKRIMIAICTFIEERYSEQVTKILLERAVEGHYDLHLDLLQFLYFFPFEGSRFHDFPTEFLKFIK